VVLPAIGTLYFTFAGIWDLPAGEEVVGSVAALTTFCGVILTVSSKRYNEGEDGPVGNFVVTRTLDGKRNVSLEFDKDPAEFINQKQIVFKLLDKDNADFWDPSAE
jgi:hypothetical protein